jgi:hypothetical protein
MTDLPRMSIAAALELVDAVRLQDAGMVAHTLRLAAGADGLEALCVSLAAMVDDSKSVSELLAWTDPPHHDADVMAWRHQLTDQQCRDYRNAYNAGNRDPEVVDGKREAERRNSRKQRMKRARQLRASEAA